MDTLFRQGHNSHRRGESVPLTKERKRERGHFMLPARHTQNVTLISACLQIYSCSSSPRERERGTELQISHSTQPIQQPEDPGVAFSPALNRFSAAKCGRSDRTGRGNLVQRRKEEKKNASEIVYEIRTRWVHGSDREWSSFEKNRSHHALSFLQRIHLLA